MRFPSFLRGVLASCAGLGCAHAAEPPRTLSIEHVTVIPMTPDGAVLRDQTVRIDKGRIQWIGDAAATPADGRQAVRDAKAEGYQFIKTYSKLTPETFLAIVDEARKNGMRVLGHIPGRESGRTADFFVPGFDLVAHAEEFAQQTRVPALDRIPEYVQMMKKNGTSLTATLTLNERLLEQTRDPGSLKQRPELLYLDPGMYQMVMHGNPYLRDTSPQRVAFLQSLVDFNRALVRACAAAGVPVLTGTDSPVPGVAPGFSLHDEFEALVRAGLSPRDVLEGTTRRAAEWLGTAADRGTVEIGKRADLVLLEANPLESIGGTRRIAAVIVNSRHLDKPELEGRMKTLAVRNRPAVAR